MKCGFRYRVFTAIALFIAIVILLAVLEDKCETYRPLAYVRASIPWLSENESSFANDFPVLVQDKILVIPAMEHENTSWVTEELSDWQNAVYIVDPSHNASKPTPLLTTPVNKGHEAMAYLTYVIDNYNSYIPSIVAFLHSHRNGFFEAWHVDTPLHDNVMAMRSLRLDFVRQSGYVNLRCNWNPGCKKLERANPHTNGEVWREIFSNTSTPVFHPGRDGTAAMEATSDIDNDEQSSYLKMSIWTPCCAQFAVSKEQIYARPLDDYVKIRQWLIDTERDDAHSGRVMEYLWHVIFGMSAISCPDQNTCYCDVYGHC